MTTMIVEPGFFRTELLTPESTTFGELSIADYDAARAESNAFWASMNGRQGGEDVVEGAEVKARLLLAQVDAHRELSTSLAHDDARAAA